MNEKFYSDNFGEVVDKFLEENEVTMTLTMPKGTQTVQVKDNVNLGPSVQLLIMMQGIIPICKELKNDLDIDAASPEWKELVYSILALFACNMIEENET